MFYNLIKKINALKTALRRAYNPHIKRGDVIIDIGSGGMPYPRADVACDFYENDFERADLLKIDRPFVWASVEYLPFDNKTFDFSIFSHVLEHLNDPAKALIEVERVSKAGYIETPNSFYEFIIPHVYHMSRCTIIDNILNITMKKKWDESLPNEFKDVQLDMMSCWNTLNSYDSKSLLTKYVWYNTINYIVHGSVGFRKPIENIEYSGTVRPYWKKILRNLSYAILKPKKINLEKILRCPLCKGSLTFNKELSKTSCEKCKKIYIKHRGCWDFRITSNN
jgi:SAM-dependent methyltransferase